MEYVFNSREIYIVHYNSKVDLDSLKELISVRSLYSLQLVKTKLETFGTGTGKRYIVTICFFGRIVHC